MNLYKYKEIEVIKRTQFSKTKIKNFNNFPYIESLEEDYDTCLKNKNTFFTLKDNYVYINADAINKSKIKNLFLPMLPYTSSGTWLSLIDFHKLTYAKALFISDNISVIEHGTLPNKSLEYLYIPSNIISSYSTAFSNYNLKEVIINSQSRNISRSMFEGCKNLDFVKLKNNISFIKSRAFANTPSLTKIELEGSIFEINDSAFENSGLKEFKIQKGPIQLGRNAFKNCPLESVYFETTDGVVLQENAFEVKTPCTIYIKDDEKTTEEINAWIEKYKSAFNDNCKIKIIKQREISLDDLLKKVEEETKDNCNKNEERNYQKEFEDKLCEIYEKY